MPAEPTKSLRLLMHPYSTLVPVREGRPELKEAARLPGSALVWVLEQGVRKVDRMLVDHRPGGLALIVILPPIVDLANDPPYSASWSDHVRTVSSRSMESSPQGSWPKCFVAHPRTSAAASRSISLGEASGSTGEPSISFGEPSTSAPIFARCVRTVPEHLHVTASHGPPIHATRPSCPVSLASDRSAASGRD